MPSKKPDKILIATGCGTCEEAKKNGMCQENKCVDISSRMGQEIAREARVKLFPEVICHNKRGKPIKCGKRTLNDVMKKYKVA